MEKNAKLSILKIKDLHPNNMMNYCPKVNFKDYEVPSSYREDNVKSENLEDPNIHHECSTSTEKDESSIDRIIHSEDSVILRDGFPEEIESSNLKPTVTVEFDQYQSIFYLLPVEIIVEIFSLSRASLLLRIVCKWFKSLVELFGVEPESGWQGAIQMHGWELFTFMYERKVPIEIELVKHQQYSNKLETSLVDSMTCEIRNYFRKRRISEKRVLNLKDFEEYIEPSKFRKISRLAKISALECYWEDNEDKFICSNFLIHPSKDYILKNIPFSKYPILLDKIIERRNELAFDIFIRTFLDCIQCPFDEFKNMLSKMNFCSFNLDELVASIVRSKVITYDEQYGLLKFLDCKCMFSFLNSKFEIVSGNACYRLDDEAKARLKSIIYCP